MHGDLKHLVAKNQMMIQNNRAVEIEAKKSIEQVIENEMTVSMIFWARKLRLTKQNRLG